MNASRCSRSASLFLVTVPCAVAALLVNVTLSAQSRYPALTLKDFRPVVGRSPAPTPQGFGLDPDGDGVGDRQNGWAWSMAWFAGKLYVGTNRAYHCMEIAAIANGTGLPGYPPNDPDVDCTPDWADLPGAAEIWAWDPADGGWTRVFQSTMDVPIPNKPGKFAARDVGFRNMHVFQGTLFVSSVSPRWYIPDNGTIPSARLLYSDDGVTFHEVTGLGSGALGGVAVSSFRGAVTFNNRFYVIAGTILGFGKVLEASSPKDGTSYRDVTPAGMSIYELGVFNGNLYLGSHNPLGFDLLKTDASGTPPYTFTTIMQHGGDRVDKRPNPDVMSMREFKGHLYVGGNATYSFNGAELFRVNPDDTWDVIAGGARPGKAPLSGLGPGMGWIANAHMWRMEVFDDRLYLGTWDLSVDAKNIPYVGNILKPVMGFDFFQTSDGVYFTEIDRHGFIPEPCLAVTGPWCRGLNLGVRTLATTPYGLFLGTANYYYGLQIWLGVPVTTAAAGGALSVATRQPEPSRLDVEDTTRAALLTWNATPGATTYLVYRANATPIRGLSIEGAPSTVQVFGEYHLIGSTTETWFADSSSALRPARYCVKAVGTDERVSQPSNFVVVPNDAVLPTFASVEKLISRYVVAAATRVGGDSASITAAYRAAVNAARSGDFAALERLHDELTTHTSVGRFRLSRAVTADLDVQLGRLVKRLRLVKARELAFEDVAVK